MLVKIVIKERFFQYVPNIRNKDDECYDEVQKLLMEIIKIKELKLNESDLSII